MARATARRLHAAVFALIGILELINGCIHDSLPHKVAGGEQKYSSSHPFIQAEEERRRRLSSHTIDIANYQTYDRMIGKIVDSSVYQPIRITPYYDMETLNQLSAAKRSLIFSIIPAAIEYFKQALTVVPVEGMLTAQHSCYYEWNTEPPVCYNFVEDETCFEMVIPQEHFGATRKCETCESQGCAIGDCSFSTSQGVPNSDFLLYVRSASTSYCSGQVLAYATSCQKDQYDRPTFGMVNFCPSKISTAQADYDDQLATALHELTHALGFSALFIPYMRNPDGTPRTARDKSGDPPIRTSGTCHNGAETDYFIEPGSTTVQYYTERGHDVAKLVTPHVAAFVKQHFACDTITGAELESNDPGCIGSHWEERLFESEYMSPVLSFRNILSGLTLAFFEDSGWYHTNASMAQRLVFGENRGCEFATDRCIDPSTSKAIASDHYCTSNAVESCSVDATSRSICTIQSGLTIPSAYQYFPSSPTVGSSNAYADYCPMNIGYSGGDCTVETNLALAPGTTINILGETYCSTCKCASTTLRSDDSSAWIVNSRRATGCYAMECVWSDQKPSSVLVTIPRSKTSDEVVVNCTAKGEQLSIPGFSGVLTCPDPVIVCSSTPTYSFLSEWAETGTVTQQPTAAPTPSRTPSATNTLKTDDASRSTTCSWTLVWGSLVLLLARLAP